MGRLERHLDQHLVARVLAIGVAPHKRGRQPPVGAPIARPRLRKWPDPIYADKLERRRKWRAGSPSS